MIVTSSTCAAIGPPASVFLSWQLGVTGNTLRQNKLENSVGMVEATAGGRIRPRMGMTCCPLAHGHSGAVAELTVQPARFSRCHAVRASAAAGPA